MRLFIDAFGDTAATIIELLCNEFDLNIQDIFVKTYELRENVNLIHYLEENSFEYTTKCYSSLDIEFEFTTLLSIFGREKIPRALLKKAIFSMNVHPSLLPKYGGCFSVPWCIINNEKVTGVTFHEISENFDEGAIIHQLEVDIDITATAHSLYSKIYSAIIQNYCSVLKKYLNNDIELIAQDLEQATYFPRQLPYEGRINPLWDKPLVERFIRAMIYPPYLPAVFYSNGTKKYITNIKEYSDAKG